MARSDLSLWDFFFGKSGDPLSSTESKLVAMTSQMGGFMVFISLIYFVIDLINHLNSLWYLQLGYAFISLLVVIANRKGFHNSARILLLVSGNIVVFLFAITEPSEIGVSVLFVTAYIGAIVGFGFEKRKIAFSLIAFTSLLVLFSVVIDLHLVERRLFSPDYIRVNFIINLTVTIVTSVVMVYYLLTLNYLSESNLQASQRAILGKNNELLKLNKELDRFVYSTSHDLRSPISSVRGLINILKLSDDPAEIKGYLAMMEDRLIHLDKFIGDIASYSRNARLTLSIKQVRVKEVIRYFADMVPVISVIPCHFPREVQR